MDVGVRVCEREKQKSNSRDMQVKIGLHRFKYVRNDAIPSFMWYKLFGVVQLRRELP